VLYTDSGSGALVDQWGERTCSASYRDHAADLPAAVVGENMSGRLRRAAASCRTDLPVGLNPAGGRGVSGRATPASRALRKLRVAARPPKGGP
jgi:hypothetical protein